MQAIYISAELSSPARQLPLALNTAIPTIILCFIAANAIYYILLPWNLISSTNSVAVVSFVDIHECVSRSLLMRNRIDRHLPSLGTCCGRYSSNPHLSCYCWFSSRKLIRCRPHGRFSLQQELAPRLPWIRRPYRRCF